MDKKDLAILGVLIALLLMWPVFGPQVEQKFFPRAPAEPAPPAEAEPSDLDAPAEAAPALPPPAEPPAMTEADAASAPAVLETPVQPEERAVLSNALVQIEVSSYGASVRSVTLNDFRESREDDSPPVGLDFDERPALTYEGLRGLGPEDAFEMTVETPAHAVRFERVNADGIKLERRVRLGEDYALEVSDTFSHAGGPVSLPASGLNLGIMHEPSAQKGRYAALNLGVDALLQGGDGVRYYGKKILPKHVRASGREEAALAVDGAVGWVAAKNRYFVQILAPEEGGQDAEVYGRRENAEAKSLDAVSAAIRFDPVNLNADATLPRNMIYYVGPKEYDVLIDYGYHFVEVMEFGFFSPISKFLLWVLNFIHDAIWPHNYGIAIILLTIIIRVLFWPITHKGTESMRRMQEIQPKIKELREKIKDPQKQQQALMALYKEHKINPLGGCLPMLVQIPVFFALFVVLRSAIELRYASFLWISDLSEPENLFADVLPIGINILPIIMAATMVWQQKLTPTTGDPRQAKMMQFMPVMMLFLFYNFASGLVLYWTTNQCLMIVQQVVYKRRRERKEAAAAA